MTTATVAETKPFQAEVTELLHLMVHSVYSETDIFLRELISNASDACDKLRYEAIANPDLVGDTPPKIRIAPGKKTNTLTISDTGIGMDRAELIDNLGTIARSGTRAFLERLGEAAKEANKEGKKDGNTLIGQFGVGFYSAFMVAERIVVTSRRAGSAEAWTWSSSGGAGFDIAPADEEQAERVSRGTEIVLHLKKDAEQISRDLPVERIVGAYSDNIQFPIELVPEEGEIRQINSASALWQRPKSEIKAEDYTQAYRAIAGAFDEPAMTLHYRAEGRHPTRCCCLLHRRSRRPVRAEPQGSYQALCAASIHHRRRRTAAELPALYSRRGRQRGPATEHLARDVAEQSAARQIKRALTGRVVNELETLADKEPEPFNKIWSAFAPC